MFINCVVYAFKEEKEMQLFILFEDGSLFFTSSEVDYFTNCL